MSGTKRDIYNLCIASKLPTLEKIHCIRITIWILTLSYRVKFRLNHVELNIFVVLNLGLYK